MADYKKALEDFTRIATSNEISNASKSTSRGFTQARKISLLDVLLYYTFRSAETTNKDISSLYSKLEKPKVSKQAMFKALDKTNPNVFPLFIRRFAENFYGHHNYNTLDGYIVLACDGTKLDLPPSDVMKDQFGGYLNGAIKEKSQVKKPQANCSILVDVLNHVVLDADLQPCNSSELPMLYRHLENCRELLKDKKVLLLCDRYYGSAELFLYCDMHGYNYIVRGKSYAFKKQVAEITTDGWINLKFDKAWLRRMKRDDTRERASNISELPVRVVKGQYEYKMTGKKQRNPIVHIDSIYFTDLEADSFDRSKVISLYHNQRWDNETAFFDIKNHLEAERFNSGKYNIVVNEIYGKILCYSFCGILYCSAMVAMERRKGKTSRKHSHIVDMKYVCDLVRTDFKLIQFLCGIQEISCLQNYVDGIVEDCAHRTVPVRPGRHFKRWGRWFSCIPTNKFRTDGRRNPPIEKCFNTVGYMTRR